MTKLRPYFFFLIFVCVNATAQTIEYCDKIIRDGVIKMNNKNHVKSLELLTEAKTLAEKNNWYKQQFLAINNIGLNYYLMLDYGEALDNYLEAFKIAVKELDSKHEVIVLNNIAILYLKEEEFDKAEEYFSKAFEIATQNNNKDKIALYASNLVSVAIEKKDVEKAEKYIQIAYSNIGDESSNYAQLQTIEANVLFLKGDLEKAKELLFHILPKLEIPELLESHVYALSLLAEISQKEGNYAEGIKFAKKILHLPQVNFEGKIAAFKLLSSLYFKVNKPEFSLEYKDSIMAIKDSLTEIKNGKLFENTRIKFELENYQKELAESQKIVKQERRIFFGILGIIILLIAVCLWAFRNYWEKLKQRKIIAENQRKIAELELEKEKNEKLILEQQLNEQKALILLEKETYKNEIEAKNRQLMVKAMSLSTRNELIENIIDTISKFSEISKNEILKKHIKELKSHLKKDSEWDDFFTHFEEVNQGFLKRLKEKHNELSPNDLRFICYIYMNLSTKEISSLLNITVEACRKRKERISKKMNLSESSDIYDYISTI